MVWAGLVGAVLLYWILNNGIVAVVLSAVMAGQFPQRAVELICSETEMLLFALAGAACGFLFTSSGTWVGALSLIGVLAAVDVMVISRSRRSVSRRLRRAWAMASASVATIVAGVCTYVTAGVVDRPAAIPIGMTAALLFASASTLLLLRRQTGGWDRQLAFGVVLSEAPFMMLAASVGLVGAVAGLLPGVVTGVLALTAAWLLYRLARRAQTPLPATDDVEALAIIDLAFHDGSLDGVGAGSSER